MTLNKKIVIPHNFEHKTARQKLVGYLKDKWIEKQKKDRR
jgi:hypothetical protein